MPIAPRHRTRCFIGGRRRCGAVRLDTIDEGLVYMQFTRGNEGDREFVPGDNLTPTIFGFGQHKSDATRHEFENGIRMISHPDIRWARRDIKTVGLMGSVFAKMAGKPEGAGEMLLHEDGVVTEGAATSFFIIKNSALITRPLSNDILHGCTRHALLSLVETGDLKLEERLFTVEEAHNADEAFITGASTYVAPVIQIDDAVIGTGKPGPHTRRLQDIYVAFARQSAI